MKNAPTKKHSESAPNKRDYTPGRLPQRNDTVRAAVLAALLESAVLTGMASVFAESTTRLAAVIHALEKIYGWHIEREDVVVDTSDGRTATIVKYWLQQETIESAFEMGAREWIDEVKTARRARCPKHVKKRNVDASKKVASRSKPRAHDPRQLGLWG